MVRRVAAVALALIAVTMAFAGTHLPAARAAAPHPEIVFMSITPYNQYDGNYFAPGIYYGSIFFLAIDDGTATTGTVTILDKNATRDGIATLSGSSSTVYSVSITLKANENDSRGTPVHFNLPEALNYSGNWWINLTTSDGSVQSRFGVNAYSTGIEFNREAFLPGHTGTAYWSVDRDSGQEFPAADLSTIQIHAWYLTNHGLELPVPGVTTSLSVASFGNFTFTVPSNASAGSYVYFYIWANQTMSGSNWSDSDYDDFYVANVTGVELTFTNCPGSCSTFAAGSPVQLFVKVDTTDSDTVADGLTLQISFYNGVTAVTAPSGTPTTLTTDTGGNASLLFVPVASAFSTSHNNSVHVSVSDPLDAAVTAANSIGFNLQSTSSLARVQLTTPSLVYYSGDSVSVGWTLGGSNSSGAPGWTMGWWYAYTYDGGYQLLAESYVGGTATSGTLVVTIPADFQGYVEVEAYAQNLTEESGGYLEFQVVQPYLIVNPSETTYRPGDTITVSVTPEGQALSSATLYQTTLDGSDAPLASGVVTGGSFSVTVPMTAPPTELEFLVAAQTTTGGVLTTQIVYVELQQGYVLQASIATASNYADNSYKPGQTITINWGLTPIGNTPTPGGVTVVVLPSADLFLVSNGNWASLPGSMTFTGASNSGSVSYTLPSNLPNGYDGLTVVAFPSQTGGGNCGSNCAIQTLTVNIQSSPSALNYELGSGSGLTVSWLILLILIVVLAILGILWVRRRTHGGSGGASKWSEPPKPFSSSPPAGSSAPESGGPAPADGASPPPPAA